jgi:hypothetical protein
LRSLIPASQAIGVENGLVFFLSKAQVPVRQGKLVEFSERTLGGRFWGACR